MKLVLRLPVDSHVSRGSYDDFAIESDVLPMVESRMVASKTPEFYRNTYICSYGKQGAEN